MPGNLITSSLLHPYLQRPSGGSRVPRATHRKSVSKKSPPVGGLCLAQEIRARANLGGRSLITILVPFAALLAHSPVELSIINDVSSPHCVLTIEVRMYASVRIRQFIAACPVLRDPNGSWFDRADRHTPKKTLRYVRQRTDLRLSDKYPFTC